MASLVDVLLTIFNPMIVNNTKDLSTSKKTYEKKVKNTKKSDKRI